MRKKSREGRGSGGPSFAILSPTPWRSLEPQRPQRKK
jgi:hypothetical protein